MKTNDEAYQHFVATRDDWRKSHSEQQAFDIAVQARLEELTKDRDWWQNQAGDVANQLLEAKRTPALVGSVHALRDAILHGIDGPDNDQTNAVLGVFDDHVQGMPAHQSTSQAFDVAGLRADLMAQRDTTETYGGSCAATARVAIEGCIDTLDEYAAKCAAPDERAQPGFADLVLLERELLSARNPMSDRLTHITAALNEVHRAQAAHTAPPTPAAQSMEQDRANFEWWYSTRVDLAVAPIGSRDCALQWIAWLAGTSGTYTAPSDWKISPLPWGPPPAAQPEQQPVALAVAIRQVRSVEKALGSLIIGCKAREDGVGAGFLCQQLGYAVDALEKAAAPVPAAAPEPTQGWQLVPVELTAEMAVALSDGTTGMGWMDYARKKWAAMLAAAPVGGTQP